MTPGALVPRCVALAAATAALFSAGHLWLAAAAILFGITALAIGWTLLLRHAYVETTGLVRRVDAADDDYSVGANLVIEATRPAIRVHAFMWLLGGTPPAAGDQVRLLVPVTRPWDAYPAPDRDRPITGVALLLGRWRIDLGRLGRLAGRPPTAGRTAEQVLTTAAEVISEVVLGWQRNRCRTLARPLRDTAEFVTLAAVFDVSWENVVGRALRDQGPIWDATQDSRAAAARALLRLPLLVGAAVTAVVLGARDVLHVGDAVLHSLMRGSVEPLRARVHWHTAVTASGLPAADLYVALAVVAVVLLVLVLVGVRAGRRGVAGYRAWHADLTGVVQGRIRDGYQRIANGQRPPLLSVRTAPSLGELTADQLVTRDETGQLRALVFDLGVGAVAISGDRGVGKSTLLRMLVTEPAAVTLGVLVTAPVRYEPLDFLLYLYAQLCQAVLDRLGDPGAGGRLGRAVLRVRRGIAALLRAAAVASLLLVLFVGTREALAARLPLPRLAGTYVIGAVALAVLAAAIRGPQPSRRLALATEAARRLRQTRFLQTVASQESVGVARSALTLGWQRSRQWAEQPHNLPELMGSYRAFATAAATWWRDETGGRGKLVVAIDEADRIADPAAAEQFVNEIKAAFGVPHCVYLVSVSEEALANFERRVVRMRTVFDSAFDHVVRLRALTLHESVDLLRHRLTGVPDVFWILCHCMAGGMPRDVLRMARTMLDLHRQSLEPSGLPELAERLVALEVQAVKRGFQQHPEAQADTALPGLLVDPAWPGRTSEDLRLAAEDRLASAPAIAAALLYYSTVLYVFTDRPYVLRRWLRSLDRPGESVSVAGLTFAHRLLATDPAVAVEQLRRVRGYLGRG